MTKQVVVFHNKNLKESVDFISNVVPNPVPENTQIFDTFSLKSSDNMIGLRDYIKEYGRFNVNDYPNFQYPCVVVNVPGYFGQTTNKNIEEHKEVLIVKQWSEVETFVNTVNKRAIDNPLK